VRNAAETRHLNTSRRPAAPRGTAEDLPSPPPAQVNTSVTRSHGSTVPPRKQNCPAFGGNLAKQKQKGSTVLPACPVEAAGSARSARRQWIQGTHGAERGTGVLVSVRVCLPRHGWSQEASPEHPSPLSLSGKGHHSLFGSDTGTLTGGPAFIPRQKEESGAAWSSILSSGRRRVPRHHALGSPAIGRALWPPGTRLHEQRPRT